MHELALHLQIGHDAAVMPDAIAGCFELATHDGPLAGATLAIAMVPGSILTIRRSTANATRWRACRRPRACSPS